MSPVRRVKGKDSPGHRQIRKRIFGTFIRAKRVERNLSQQEVAAHLSYSSAQFVSNWERGVSLPPLDAMPQLARLYKVTSREFIEVFTRYQRAIMQLDQMAIGEAFERARDRR